MFGRIRACNLLVFLFFCRLFFFCCGSNFVVPTVQMHLKDTWIPHSLDTRIGYLHWHCCCYYAAGVAFLKHSYFLACALFHSDFSIKLPPATFRFPFAPVHPPPLLLLHTFEFVCAECVLKKGFLGGRGCH